MKEEEGVWLECVTLWICAPKLARQRRMQREVQRLEVLLNDACLRVSQLKT